MSMAFSRRISRAIVAAYTQEPRLGGRRVGIMDKALLREPQGEGLRRCPVKQKISLKGRLDFTAAGAGHDQTLF